MKQTTYGTLGGLEVPVMIYESYTEADGAAGKPNAMLEIGNDNLHYRGGTASSTREFIVELLEKKFPSLKRTMKPSGKTTKVDGKDVPIMTPAESEGEYVKRVMGAQKLENLKQFQADLNTWAASAYSEFDEKGNIKGSPVPLQVDAKEPERKPKLPPRLSEEDKALATEFITGKKDLTKFAKAAQKYNIVVAPLTKDNTKDIEAVGWNVKAFFKAKADEAKAAAKAAF